jgi:hypothetical protein
MRWTTTSAAALCIAAAAAGAALAEEGKTSAVTFEEGLATFEAVLEKARAEKKPVFLDFWSPG